MTPVTKQHHDTLTKLGWKQVKSRAAGIPDDQLLFSQGEHSVYKHPKYKGHAITVFHQGSDEGSWAHEAHYTGEARAGDDHEELKQHLTNLHKNMSQHSEPLDLQLSEEETKPDLTDKLTTAGPVLGPAVQFREEPPIAQFSDQEQEDMHASTEAFGYTRHARGKYKHDYVQGHKVEIRSDGGWSHIKPGKRPKVTSGHGEASLIEHLSNEHPEQTESSPAVQFREDDDDEDGAPGNVSLSKHHVALKKKGYRFKGTSAGGWTAHYEHPEGRKARIEWQNSNDTHGTVHHG